MRTRTVAALLAIAMLTALFPARADAAASYTEYELYVERPASEAGTSYYHGAKFEPKTGAYLAMYAEGDGKMHDWNVSTYDGWYFGGVPRYTGKEHAAYMLYVHYEDADAISHYASHYRAAAELGKGIQICIEPTNGLDEVQNDAHLRALAQQANDAGIPLFIRFASEFNDSGNVWHKDGAEKYIEKFRLVADTFHAYAPNAAMVWAPNDWPIGSEDAYYPGDAYVDWIGVASYPVFYADGSPKQANTWMDRFHLLYENYGSRKPIFVTEGAPSSTVEYHPEQDVSDAAQYEIRRFYAGAARRYPNLKMIVYWSEDESWGRLIHCELTANAALLSAYQSAIADPYYLGGFNTSSDVYYQKVSETTMKEGSEKLSCYVNDVKHRVAKAVYYIDDVYVGEGRFPDYTASVDFSPYAGRTVSLRADFYDEQDAYVTAKTVSVAVNGTAKPGATTPAPSAKPVVVPTSQNLAVNGEKRDTEIYNIDGSNYFKLRDVAALLNGTSSQFSVAWDAAAQTISVRTGETYGREPNDLAIPSKADMEAKAAGAVVSAQKVTINGEAVELSAYNIGGNNFFKLRDLGDALNFGVDWDAAASTMVVTSK